MAKIGIIQAKYINSDKQMKFDIEPTCRAFAQFTGFYPIGHEAIKSLDENKSYIFHSILSEQIAPVRVIFGFRGFADEYSLRKGFEKFLKKNLKISGFGVNSLPNLIVCGNSALLKMNGHPYGCPMLESWWPIMVSNSENPLRLLIEIIWTRLSNQFRAEFPMDDSLQMERLVPFFSARIGRLDDKIGWEYNLHNFKRKQLSEIKPWSWTPGELDENESVFLIRLAQEGEIDVRNLEYRNYAINEGFDPDKLISNLVSRRIIAWCGEFSVKLISNSSLYTTFMPDGRTFSSSDEDLLHLWLEHELADKTQNKNQ